MKVKEWVYYLGDEQLSVRQLMDSNGNITLSRTYDPFGQILQETGSGSAIYGFAGAQAGGGGLLYINGRYFDPTTGRFLSPDNNFDPLRPGTLNGYLSAAFLFVPFSAIIWRKRKKWGGRYDLMLFLVLGIGLGMMLVSCGGSEDGGGTPTHFFGTDTPIVTGQPPDLAPTPNPSSTPLPPTNAPTNPPTTTPNNPTPTPTPCPPTDTPTPAGIPWHYQNNKTVYPAVPLTEEEIRLTVVMTFSEGSNGTHSEESLRMLAWTYLNKKAIRSPGSDMYDVLITMSSAWNTLGNSPDIRNEVGDMPLGQGAAQRTWMLNVSTMYYSPFA